MKAPLEMNLRHWMRAVAAQQDLYELIDQVRNDLHLAGVDADGDSPEMNRLTEVRLKEHANADLVELCKAQGIYDAICAAADQAEAEAARPLRVVKDA